MKSFKRNNIILLLITILIYAVTATAYAQDSTIYENPNIHFIIEGNRQELAKTPIIINGSSLVPLRALLLSLDVNNDDIYWNNEERSVIIKKAATEIYLKIGSKSARVNGEEVILDAAPIIYNDSTYIPVRFVSQALNKIVVWDDSTSSVLIRDQDDYLNIEWLFNNCVNALTNFSSAEINSQSRIRYYGTIWNTISKKLSIPNELKTNTIIKFIQEPVQLYMGKSFDSSSQSNSIFGFVSTIVNKEIYIVQNGVYVKLLGKWIRYDLNSQQRIDEEKEAHKYIFDIKDIVSDKVYAGFKIDTTLSDDSNIVLRGNLALLPLIEKFNQSGISLNLSNAGKTDFSIVLYIDRRTYLPVRRIITFDVYYEESEKSFGIEGSEDCSYSFNSSNTVIQVPREATEGFKLF